MWITLTSSYFPFHSFSFSTLYIWISSVESSHIGLCVQRGRGKGCVFSWFRQISPNLWKQIGFSSKRAYSHVTPGVTQESRSLSAKLPLICKQFVPVQPCTGRQMWHKFRNQLPVLVIVPCMFSFSNILQPTAPFNTLCINYLLY